MRKFEDLNAEEEFQVWARSDPLPSLAEVRKRRAAMAVKTQDTSDRSRSEYGSGPEERARAYISNHTGYSQLGSHNWEHDDTGNLMNLSGVVDEFVNARIDGEGLEPGYDYDAGGSDEEV